MSIKNILLLGDSTSMSIGCYQHTFPNFLMKKKIWSKNAKLYNCSVHGFGSADALKFIKSKKIKNLDYVIINLGICDSISNENLKKKYNFFSNFRKKSKQFNNIHFNTWNKNYSNMFSLTESDLDFESNIKSIIKISKKISNEIIMIIPSSNDLFHPGLAKGNFSYYFFFDLDEKSSDVLEFEISDLKLAMKYKEEQNYSKSNEIYFNILNNNSDIDSELSFMIANNYAINLALNGDFNKSIESLKILLDEENIRKEIIFYNIAKIYKKIGKYDLHNAYLNKSYNSDVNNYRIKNNFRNILINLSKIFDIEYIDINNLKNKLFYDHCHLTEKGHLELSEILLSKINKKNEMLSCTTKIENILLNPEYSNGNDKTFNNYFNIIPKINIDFSEEIKKISLTITSKGNQKLNIHESVDNEFYESINYYLSHPFFNNLILIEKVREFHPFFYGKFPELFIIALIQFAYNFLDEKYIDPSFIDKDLFLSKFKRESIYRNLNLKIDLDQEINFDDIDIFSFLENMKQKLKYNIDNYSKNNSPHKRRKYTMYWFFRESVRFGTQSRSSMFYNLIELQNLYESSILGIGLKKFSGYQDDNYFEKIKSALENLKKINEKYVKSYESNVLNFFEDFATKQYQMEIENCLKKI